MNELRNALVPNETEAAPNRRNLTLHFLTTALVLYGVILGLYRLISLWAGADWFTAHIAMILIAGAIFAATLLPALATKNPIWSLPMIAAAATAGGVCYALPQAQIAHQAMSSDSALICGTIILLVGALLTLYKKVQDQVSTPVILITSFVVVTAIITNLT